MKKRLFMLSILGISISALLAGCNPGGGSGSNLSLGMDAIEAQEYSEALTCLNRALAEGEDKRLTYRGLGIAHMGLGEYDRAVDDFMNSLKGSNGLVGKLDYDINYYMALSQFKSGDLDAALDTYNAILGLDDKQADAHYLRGRIELLKNDKTAALADFDRAVELKSSDYDLYISIYEALDDAGDKQDGENYINMALQKNGRMTDYQSGLFSYYLGKYDEARQSLEAARKDDESDKLVLYLGRSYEALGDMNYAATLYREYLEKDPDSACIYNEEGLMYLKQEEYMKALTAFENGMALNDPSYNQSLMFNEAVTYEYLLDFKKAAVLMKEYIEKYPDDEEAQREYIFLSTR